MFGLKRRSNRGAFHCQAVIYLHFNDQGILCFQDERALLG